VCNNGNVLDRYQTLNLGIKLFHYSYVCENQILFKSKFYKNEKYIEFWEQFKHNKNVDIFGSKSLKFLGQHPEIIVKNYIMGVI
jgi:hypothetical protein